MRTTLRILCLLALLTPSIASAQGAASETFEPQATESTAIWSTATTDTVDHLVPTLGIVLHYADDPIILSDEDGNIVARVLDDQLKADLTLGLGLWDRVELGFVLPVVLHQSGESFADLPAVSTQALADLRAQARVRILRFGGLGLAAQVVAYIPPSSGEPYQSTGEFGALPALILDYKGEGAIPWRLAANLGWQLQPKEQNDMLSTDDSLDWRVGAEVGILPNTVHLMASTYGQWEAVADTPRSVSAEFLGGAKVFWGNTGLTSTVGAGGGFAPGYGTPDFRALVSLGYTPATSDLDGDGVPSDIDQCDEPEDIDGFEDSDGCPDPDNDNDGINDEDDQCPNEPEDVDQFQDEDGCPDPDNDQDGVADFDDACPLEAGEAARQGCPFVDDDNDGIDALVDACPTVAEDIDQFEDEDGCPDPDNDQDGILDVDDKCPNEPESINGVQDEDGCPDEGESKVRLTGNRIEILEKVYFDTGKAVIKERSYGVLRQVAALMKANPDIRVLRVEGHTDSRGKEDNNRLLSQRRASAVKEFLVKEGVDAGTLSARGYGESHPIADNRSGAGRAENRRVEFHIIKREVK